MFQKTLMLEESLTWMGRKTIELVWYLERIFDIIVFFLCMYWSESTKMKLINSPDSLDKFRLYMICFVLSQDMSSFKRGFFFSKHQNQPYFKLTADVRFAASTAVRCCERIKDHVRLLRVVGRDFKNLRPQQASTRRSIGRHSASSVDSHLRSECERREAKGEEMIWCTRNTGVIS